MDTFSPALAPSMGSDASFMARTIKNNFGDGYRQTLKDGLNAVAASFPATWNSLLPAQADYICQFLEAHVGKPFLYTLPRETTPRVWDCEKWTRSWTAGNIDKVTAQFEQRFDLY